MEYEGVKLQLDANDWITRIMIEEGRFEGLSLDRARKIMEGGGNFVDVGANFGLYTCTVGNIPGVKCLAVDASAEMMKVFQKNVSLNPSVKAEEALTALGSEYGKVKFFCPNQGNKGTSKTVLMDEGVSGDYIVLDCVPLEALLAERKIKPIRLLKIDIEGFEMEVFKVFDFNGQYRPSNIIMEFIPRLHSDGISLGSCRAFFEERGYELLNVSGAPIRSEADVQEDNIWLRSL